MLSYLLSVKYFLVLNISAPFSWVQLYSPGTSVDTALSLLSFRVFLVGYLWGGLAFGGKNWVLCRWQSIVWFVQRQPSPLPWQQLRAILNF